MNARVKVAGLGASAALLVALVAHEGYTDKAVIPVKGDVPTVGFGSTTRPDGTPVRMGDTTTPVQALQRTLAHIQVDESGIKRCVTAPLTQSEYDAYVSLTYNIGAKAFCGSTLVRKLNQQDYVGACLEILNWDKFKGKPLRGLTTRRKEEYNKCMDGQP